ncbi:MAG: response regulator [Nitrospirae bacterium]|nr:MAG: response regulator [Nitrospirota bacterium]
MKKKVVVIEDEDGIREFLEYLLSEVGFEVKSYNNAPAFLSDSESATTSFDFIITDNYMPHMKGIELVERLKTTKPSRAKHYAVISGSWTEDDLIRAQRLGCKTISKPFGMAEILSWINSANEEDFSPFFDTHGHIG